MTCVAQLCKNDTMRRLEIIMVKANETPVNEVAKALTKKPGWNRRQAKGWLYSYGKGDVFFVVRGGFVTLIADQPSVPAPVAAAASPPPPPPPAAEPAVPMDISDDRRGRVLRDGTN
ncbi:hypothetical protein HKX48_004988, partial [Thoreauomyces humboldtii]